MRFNLSEWALRHRSLVTYLMLVIAVQAIISAASCGLSGASAIPDSPNVGVTSSAMPSDWPSRCKRIDCSRIATF